MPSILLSKSDQEYLEKCAIELKMAYGIIVGQKVNNEKYVVVHLAKNSEEDVDLPEGAVSGQLRVEDIDTHALTSQWISASKMIPGSFIVLGVFVTAVSADIVGEQSFTEAKKLLSDVQELLLQGNNFIGSVSNNDDDYLYMAYSTAAKKAICKSFSHIASGGTFMPMDCRFVEKSFEWYSFECSYELDDIFPIVDAVQKINIEHQFQKTIDSVRRNLASSEIFIQNDSVENSLSLDAYIKKKASSRKGLPEPNNYKAIIFLPIKCQLGSEEHPIKVRQFDGTIRFAGVISSRIWCNPKITLGDVKDFVRSDILRSLAARIQVYCDGLTEPNVSHDAIFISEPPRRVYFNLPTSGSASNTSPIQFSEYIFRGEAPTVAVAQAKQILDIDISTEIIVDDQEGLPDDEVFSANSMDSSTMASTTSTTPDISRTMYMVGIAVALLVLLVSIMMHYVLRE